MSFQCTIEAIRASCLHPQVQHVPWGTIPDIEDQRTWRIVSKAARKKWDHTQEDPLTKRMSWIGDAVMYVLATAVIDMRYGLMDRQTKSETRDILVRNDVFNRIGYELGLGFGHTFTDEELDERTTICNVFEAIQGMLFLEATLRINLDKLVRMFQFIFSIYTPEIFPALAPYEDHTFVNPFDSYVPGSQPSPAINSALDQIVEPIQNLVFSTNLLTGPRPPRPADNPDLPSNQLLAPSIMNTFSNSVTNPSQPSNLLLGRPVSHHAPMSSGPYGIGGGLNAMGGNGIAGGSGSRSGAVGANGAVGAVVGNQREGMSKRALRKAAKAESLRAFQDMQGSRGGGLEGTEGAVGRRESVDGNGVGGIAGFGGGIAGFGGYGHGSRQVGNGNGGDGNWNGVGGGSRLGGGSGGGRAESRPGAKSASNQKGNRKHKDYRPTGRLTAAAAAHAQARTGGFDGAIGERWKGRLRNKKKNDQSEEQIELRNAREAEGIDQLELYTPHRRPTYIPQANHNSDPNHNNIVQGGLDYGDYQIETRTVPIRSVIDDREDNIADKGDNDVDRETS